MRCPECGSPQTHVVETRDAEDSIRRRRRCDRCDHRFTTYERPEITRLTVRGPTGGERSVTRSWLAAVLHAAARTVPDADIQDVAAYVEAQLRLAGQRTVASGEIAAVAAAPLQLAALRAGGAAVRPSLEQVETALDAGIPPPRLAPGPAQLALPLE